MDISGLLSLLIWLVLVGLIFYVLWWGLAQIGLGPPFDKVIRIVLVVALVLVLVYLLLGVLPIPHTVKLR
jgi:VIT1/CCC1 family predicted Fe2+/Mn2+ transporter